jgi:hypothetical protein
LSAKVGGLDLDNDTVMGASSPPPDSERTGDRPGGATSTYLLIRTINRHPCSLAKATI